MNQQTNCIKADEDAGTDGWIRPLLQEHLGNTECISQYGTIELLKYVTKNDMNVIHYQM